MIVSLAIHQVHDSMTFTRYSAWILSQHTTTIYHDSFVEWKTIVTRQPVSLLGIKQSWWGLKLDEMQSMSADWLQVGTSWTMNPVTSESGQKELEGQDPHRGRMWGSSAKINCSSSEFRKHLSGLKLPRQYTVPVPYLMDFLPNLELPYMNNTFGKHSKNHNTCQSYGIKRGSWRFVQVLRLKAV